MNGWGGKRPNQTGRPKKPEGQRAQHQIPQHQIRAYDDEWDLIRRFAALVKHVDRSACEEAVRKLESMQGE